MTINEAKAVFSMVLESKNKDIENIFNDFFKFTNKVLPSTYRKIGEIHQIKINEDTKNEIIIEYTDYNKELRIDVDETIISIKCENGLILSAYMYAVTKFINEINEIKLIISGIKIIEEP